MSEFIEREFGWDDEIAFDYPEYSVLPEGEYDFKITNLERGRHNGSEKLPPCPVAKVTFEISNGSVANSINTNLFLHSKCEGKLCEFFTCIGFRKYGEKLNMNWNIIGKTGKCKVGVKKYEGKDYNEIKKFFEPKEKTAPSASFSGWGNKK